MANALRDHSGWWINLEIWTQWSFPPPIFAHTILTKHYTMSDVPSATEAQPSPLSVISITVDRVKILWKLLDDMEERQKTAERTHAQLESMHRSLLSMSQRSKEVRGELREVEAMLAKSKSDRATLSETFDETLLDFRLALAVVTKKTNFDRREEANQAVAKYGREHDVK